MLKKDLQKAAGISAASTAKPGKGEYVATNVLVKICKVLDCNISDIVEIVEEWEKSTQQVFVPEVF